MKKILVVEDDPHIMNLIVILLEREGYTVVKATSAEEGISLAHAGPLDLILMDVALPGLDGLEATRILKEAGPTSRVPVIALTAQARKEDEERALRAGCDGFIPKPLSTRAFLEQVSGFLGEHGREGKG
jgi:two-component system, cell cycle response regulator DivK